MNQDKVVTFMPEDTEALGYIPWGARSLQYASTAWPLVVMTRHQKGLGVSSEIDKFDYYRLVFISLQISKKETFINNNI